MDVIPWIAGDRMNVAPVHVWRADALARNDPEGRLELIAIEHRQRQERGLPAVIEMDRHHAIARRATAFDEAHHLARTQADVAVLLEIAHLALESFEGYDFDTVGRTRAAVTNLVIHDYRHGRRRMRVRAAGREQGTSEDGESAAHCWHGSSAAFG